ncbi:MAG: hypothetical protein EOS54_04080 [Mesorhizobium sp.]|nr:MULTISPECIES: hypothetical protein [unclassified Mesorhizobium]AZO48396.1 hypothetical protein EJ073_11630 [Mesorhizobium sp. M4B.F.Ca.ET.058.02.1.1]RWC57916.1 MAG: hypothetical protein EOS54_04080 [Mesorhizobium sp.]RWD15418.1 MAG: hypothetical protein EOS74_13210 [Mesorhizobium sp.]RWD56654.1 MAG: hypothetical protein EOS75_11500 [Mesorhizobium sp.]TIU69690.1 MAG: hypothetical protein E5W25_09250 [Mesorhizobium sp.]
MPFENGDPESGVATEHMSNSLKTLLAGVTLFPLVLVANGAIPGYMSPTAGQAFWLLGFSKSFVNFGSLHAHNFGLPQPAAISFGMSAALPAAVLLKAGASPANAYAAVFAMWLAIAFAGAFWFARYIEAGRPASLLSALIWCTFPIVWQHNGYSAVALGIALLPLYYLAAIAVLIGRLSAWSCLAFVGAAFVAVFMDGYTFMMFASGTALMLGCTLASRRHNLKMDLLYRALIIAFAFGASYVAYSFYEGTPTFATEQIDGFRGWGANLEFFFVPTYGVLAIPDVLGLSAARAQDNYFGDASTFVSTFCAGIMMVALYGALTLKGRKLFLLAFGLMAIAGFYMALGPTVKFLTYRPADASQLMPALYGWFETGNAWISEYLPGFKIMRASYRWTALGMFGCWAIFVLMLASEKLSMNARAALLLILLVFNIPSNTQLDEYRHFRNVVNDLTDEIASWKPHFHKGERVAFLPYGNDFLINYIASELDIRAYNVGGDKNLAYAIGNWPREMTDFEQGKVAPEFAMRVRAFLESGKVDAVVLPYINLLWAAHDWPAPDEREKELSPIAMALDAEDRYDVDLMPHYAVVRLAHGLDPAGTLSVWNAMPPIDLGKPANFVSGEIGESFLVGRGWYRPEPLGTWSREKQASILVDVTDIPDGGKLSVRFSVFAPGDACTKVEIRSGTTVMLDHKYCGVSGMISVDLPATGFANNGQLDFLVDQLRSPSAYGSGDTRTLGVLLQSLAVVK